MQMLNRAINDADVFTKMLDKLQRPRHVRSEQPADQQHDQCATANMTAALAGELGHAALMFLHVDEIVGKALGAHSTARHLVADPGESRRQ